MRMFLTAAVVFGAACGGGAEREAPAAEAGSAATPEQWVSDSVEAPAPDAGTVEAVVSEADDATTQVVTTPAAAPQPLILDVRTLEEYAAGHVAGTVHIPLDQLEQRWQELAQYRNQPVIVYCRTGRRSAAAIDLLATKGFSRLENGGGVSQMARRGLRMSPEDCC
jgi:rhodanese-related sulfurtransferase